MGRTKTAVVVGATNGIGKAISNRLASAGFRVVVVGRNREGRAQEVVDELARASSSASNNGEEAIKHEFRPCDAFQLAEIKECAGSIVRDYGGVGKGGIDALIMSQGMATIQSFTPTPEGNDQKLTLHFWSRAAFATCLLPVLRPESCGSPEDKPTPVVLTVLSGGVHSSYSKYKDDPELRENYSIKNAADFAGYYTDLFFDKLAQQPSNKEINFIHASPGFVASNWGTEMPVYLRGPIRLMQKLGGRTPAKCAEYMVDPVLSCASGQKLKFERPDGAKEGLYIMKEDATGGKLSKGHTPEAIESVWTTTKDILGKAGIYLEG